MHSTQSEFHLVASFLQLILNFLILYAGFLQGQFEAGLGN